jgi:hypothetical protein
MRISIISFKKDEDGGLFLNEAAMFAANHHQSNLLVLPGYITGTREGKKEIIQKIVDEAKISILAELAGMAKKRSNTYYFSPSAAPEGPFTQQFKSGKPANKKLVEKVEKLLDEFEQTRVVEANGKKIGVLLCGENNILQNSHKTNTGPKPRGTDKSWPFSAYDILVNPSHTIMGQWNLLHERFSYFSEGQKTLLYCTNNTNKSAWKSSLCIYQDSLPVIMGDMKLLADFATIQTKVEHNWRLITIDIP